VDAVPDDHHEEGDDNIIALDDESCNLGPEVSSNSSVDWLEHNDPNDDPISLQQEHAYTSTGAEPVTEKVLTTTKQREKFKAKFGRVKASDEYTQNDDVKPVATSITHAIQDGIIAPPLNEPTKEHRSSTASTSGGGVQLVMPPIPKDHREHSVKCRRQRQFWSCVHTAKNVIKASSLNALRVYRNNICTLLKS
jgi:hypothetical protein